MDGGRRSRRRRGRCRRVDWIKLVEKAIHLPGAHPIRQIVRFRINSMFEQNGTWIRDKSAAQFRIAPSLCNEVGTHYALRSLARSIRDQINARSGIARIGARSATR
jgi:hypothetical protein